MLICHKHFGVASAGQLGLQTVTYSVSYCVLHPPRFHAACAGGPAEVEDCRQWLKQMQGYVLHLTKQVQTCTVDGTLSESSSTSSMDEAGSSNSSTAGTAAAVTAWRVLCQDAAEMLSRVADQMESGGGTSSVSPVQLFLCVGALVSGVAVC